MESFPLPFTHNIYLTDDILLPVVPSNLKRKFFSEDNCFDEDEKERDSKILKTQHLGLMDATIFDLDISQQMCGFNNYFGEFSDSKLNPFSDDFFSCETKIFLENDWEMKEVEEQEILEEDLSVFSEETYQYTSLEDLENERFPGFSHLPLSQQLDFIADSLLKFPHKDTFKLIKLFNLVNHNRGSLMVNATECGHSILIKRLVNRLKKIQKFSENGLTQNISEFQSDGFHMLGLLSRSSCGRDGIAAEGGLPLIMDQIKRTQNTKVFRYCAFALGNLVNSLAADEGGTFKQLIEGEKIIEIMLEILRQNNSDCLLAENICFAIGNLAFICDFEEIIIREKGIELILDLMEKHSMQAPMLTNAIFFLKNFAYGETGRSVIMENGGAPKILKVMNDHLEHSDLLELSINLLFDLSFSGAVDVIMKNSHGIQLILNGMLKHQNHVPLIREAIRTLSRIFTKSNDEQKKILY